MGGCFVTNKNNHIQTIVIKQLNYDSQLEKAEVMRTFFER